MKIHLTGRLRNASFLSHHAWDYDQQFSGKAMPDGDVDGRSHCSPRTTR